MKSIGLIQAIILLHQRPKKIRKKSRKLRYIEATPENIALASKLLQEVAEKTQGLRIKK